MEGVKAGHQPEMEQLFELFKRSVGHYFARQLGLEDQDDNIHDTFVIVIKEIRRGGLREPDHLMGFVRTVVRRQVAAQIEELARSRRAHAKLELGASVAEKKEDPEQQAMIAERRDLIAATLASMKPRDRAILERYYLAEHSEAEIAREMSLTETQSRLLRARAKARFGEAGRKILARRTTVPEPLSDFFQPLTSARTIEIEAAMRLATEVFEDPRVAEKWLKEPNLGTDNLPPLGLLETRGGFDRVKLLLQRIEYGVLT